MINQLERKLKKGAAAFLAFCVTATSCYTNTFAAIRDDDEDYEIPLVECVIDMDWDKMEQAITDAIQNRRILKDESDFQFLSDDSDTVAQYRQLLAASKENPLYTVDYKFNKKDLPDKTSIQVFVRKDGNEAVAFDDRQEWEDEEMLMDSEPAAQGTPSEARSAEVEETDGVPEEGQTADEADGVLEEGQTADETDGVLEEGPAADETDGVLEEGPAADETDGVLEEEQSAEADGIQPEDTALEETVGNPAEEAAEESAQETAEAPAAQENAAETEAAPARDDSYELTGNEQLIILFTNKSSKDVAYQFRINGYLTPKTYVYCADTLKEEMKDALEPEKKVPETTTAIEVVEPVQPGTAGGAGGGSGSTGAGEAAGDQVQGGITDEAQDPTAEDKQDQNTTDGTEAEGSSDDITSEDHTDNSDKTDGSDSDDKDSADKGTSEAGSSDSSSNTDGSNGAGSSSGGSGNSDSSNNTSDSGSSDSGSSSNGSGSSNSGSSSSGSGSSDSGSNTSDSGSSNSGSSSNGSGSSNSGNGSSDSGSSDSGSGSSDSGSSDSGSGSSDSGSSDSGSGSSDSGSSDSGSGSSDSGTSLSMSRHEVPVVAAAEEKMIDTTESLDPVLLKTSARSSSASATVGLAAFSLFDLRVGAKENKVSLTIANRLSSDSDQPIAAYQYEVAIQYTGDVTIESGDADIADEADGKAMITFTLNSGESMSINMILGSLDSAISYKVVQKNMDDNECVDITNDLKKTSITTSEGSGGTDGEGTEDGSLPSFDLDPEAYGSWIERGEAMVSALNQIDNKNSKNEKSPHYKLFEGKVGYANNDEYRKYLTEHTGGIWPTAVSQGLRDVLLMSKHVNENSNLDNYYLHLYIRPCTDKNPKAELVPYISPERTNSGAKWKAYMFYDYKTNAWYQFKNTSLEYSMSGLNSMNTADLLATGKWEFLVKGDYEGTFDKEDSTASGSLQNAGYLYNAAVTFTNRYTTPIITYTVTFYDIDGQILSQSPVVENTAVTNVPTPPAVDGKTFVKWDQDLNYVTSDLDVYPVYEDDAPVIPDVTPPEETPDDSQNNGNQGGETTPDDNQNSGDQGTVETPDNGSTDNGNTDNGSTGNGAGSGSGGSSGGSSSSGGPGRTTDYVDQGPGHSTAEIAPTPVPLAVMPADASSAAQQALAVIDDGEVPLSALPKTGNRGAAAHELTMLVSGVLLAVYAALSNKKKADS